MKSTRQRYVLIRGQIYRWEEKAPFVPSGRGPEGAIEYDRDNDALQCHECGQWYQWLGRHIARVHSDIGNVEYKVRHGLRASAALIAPAAKADRDMQPDEIARRTALSKRSSHPWSREKILATWQRSLTERRKEGFVARVQQSKERRNEQNACDAQILFKLKQLIVDREAIPYTVEIEPELRTRLLRRFGTIGEALARLEIDPSRQFDARAVLIEDLRDFYVLNRRLPRANEFGTGRLASLLTYITRFYSLVNAYEEAGLYKVWFEEQMKGMHMERPLLNPAEFQARFTA